MGSDSKEAHKTICARTRPAVLPAQRFARMTEHSVRALSLIFLLSQDVGERARAHTHAARLKITKCRITIATITTNTLIAQTPYEWA